MTIITLGAGRMAYGLVFDFLRNQSIKKIIVIDSNSSSLNNMKSHFNNSRLEFYNISGDNLKDLKPFFEQAAGAVSAIPYDFNAELTQLAIDCKTHFVDLGGNNSVVEKQFKLSDMAKRNDVGIIPDCGLAPGMVSVITAFAIDQFPDSIGCTQGGFRRGPGQHQDELFSTVAAHNLAGAAGGTLHQVSQAF